MVDTRNFTLAELIAVGRRDKEGGKNSHLGRKSLSNRHDRALS